MGRCARRRLVVQDFSGPHQRLLVSRCCHRLSVVSSMYVELHAASAFSFLDGASLPEALVDRAVELGYPALALLDRDGVYGAPRFHLAAKKAGLKAIVGAELSIAVVGSGGWGVANDTRRSAVTAHYPPPTAHPSTRKLTLPVLIESQQGYRNLCRLLTQMKLRAPKGEGALALEELDGHTS